MASWALALTCFGGLACMGMLKYGLALVDIHPLCFPRPPCGCRVGAHANWNCHAAKARINDPPRSSYSHKNPERIAYASIKAIISNIHASQSLITYLLYRQSPKNASFPSHSASFPVPIPCP